MMLQHIINELVSLISNIDLHAIQFLPIAFGFTSGSYDQIQRAKDVAATPVYYSGRKFGNQYELDRYLGAQGPQRSKYGYGPIDVSQLTGYNLYKNLATEKGPSAATRYSMQNALMNRQNQIDASAGAQAGAYNQALSNLASRGGVASGSRERLAGLGQNQGLLSKNAAYRDYNINILDLLKQDATQKQSAAEKFAGLEGDYATKNMDIVKDIYNQDVANWGARRQAGDTASEVADWGLGGTLFNNAGSAYNQGMFSNAPYNMMNTLKQPTGGIKRPQPGMSSIYF